MASPQNMFIIGLFMTSVLIVFSQRHLITTMPERLVVLSNSCVQIPCTFDIPEDKRNDFKNTVKISGVWIKDYHKVDLKNVIFNSSKNDNRYQGKITGNMSQKNCTTVFFNVTTSYTNKYYFRIESKPYSATDHEKYVQINVQDSPEQPDMTFLGDIKEGTPVSLNCSAVAPCPEHPPKLIWTLPTNSTFENQIQENTNQTITVLSTVIFIPSYHHNDKNITCTAVYPVGTSFKTVELTWTLHVIRQENSKVCWIVKGTLLVVLLILLISFLGWRKSKLPGGLEWTNNQVEQVNDNQVHANQATTRKKPAELEGLRSTTVRSTSNTKRPQLQPRTETS
ncbi:myelin-associated glycoprotein [Esox lucius]|uniref:Ig-like domain-containing protein n=1 Tax=Esox lucius TaxID=8010 RepID=A0AAY5L8P9_ESOLU|nr:myelin-associated glycoprotein [Esox lucius]